MGEWSGWEGWKRWGQRGPEKEEACPGWNDRVCRTGSQAEGNDCSTCAAGDLAWLRWRAHVVKGKMVQGLEWRVGNGEQARFVLEVGLISSRVTEHPKYQLTGR